MSDKPQTTEQPAESPSKAEAIAKIVEMRDQLKRQNEQRFTGAAPAATATMLLDKSDAESKNPDKRIRWVSLRNAQKAAARQASGYVRLSAEEGGRQVGDLVLMGLPREEHERRVAAIKKVNEARLTAHNKEHEQLAEAVAKELRDRHGVSVSAERILIVER